MNRHIRSGNNYGGSRRDDQMAQDAFHAAEILRQQMQENFLRSEEFNEALPRPELREELQRAWGGH